MTKIYLYINDCGDGSSSISYFKSEEDRQKQKDYDEHTDHSVDGCDDFEIDTDNIEFDEPRGIEDDEEEENEGG